MRLARWSLPLRLTMLAVALCALLLAAVGLGLRRESYLEMAEFHRAQMTELAAGADMARHVGNPRSARQAALQRDYHAALWKRYTRAASRPWQRVGPEPPPP